MSTEFQSEFHPDTYRVSTDQPLGDLYVRSIRNAEQSGTPIPTRRATSEAERTRAREVRRLVDKRTYGPGSTGSHALPLAPDLPWPPRCELCGTVGDIRPTRLLWPREGDPIPLAWRCVGSCGGQRSEATDRIRAG